MRKSDKIEIVAIFTLIIIMVIGVPIVMGQFGEVEFGRNRGIFHFGVGRYGEPRDDDEPMTMLVQYNGINVCYLNELIQYTSQ